MTRPILISPEQRDALYEQISIRLTRIDGIYRALEEQNFETADRLSGEVCDELHLVRRDLGWGERSDNQPIALASPPELLRRVLERFRREAHEIEPEISGQGTLERNRRLIAVCDELLADLEGTERSQ